VAAVIVLVLGVNLAPSLVYRAEHGSNPRITRTTADAEAFGLKLAGLVLPVREHRVGFLSDLNARYFDVPVPYYCEACYSTLGTVGDVGFLWLGGIALASVLGLGGLARGRPLERRAALAVALSLAIATVGGVSGLIALFLTADVRGWSRMSLFIAFFSLLAAALLVDRLSGRMQRRGWPSWLGGVAIGGVLVLGVADETSPYFLPMLGPTQREWRSDRTFTRQIQARMPRGAAIFQLPQMPFPEGFGEPVFGLEIYGAGFNTSYELMRGYLHSSTLRLSAGRFWKS
jgi:phosphoglycerol transferase